MTPYQSLKYWTPATYSYYQTYRNPGLLHAKIFLEFLKLNILLVVYSIELCECSLTAGNYLLSYMNINCGNAPEARDSYFTTYYSFNKIVLDIIIEKFDIQVDENTRNQAALLHDDIPGYDLPTIDFVQTTTDQDEDISILEEDNSQIYAHLNNVLVHILTTNKQPFLNRIKISMKITRKYSNISNMQRIGKLHQSYVLIQQWHVMYYLS